MKFCLPNDFLTSVYCCLLLEDLEDEAMALHNCKVYSDSELAKSQEMTNCSLVEFELTSR